MTISYTYQWNKNGVAISGATTQNFVVSGSAGDSITCTITASNGSLSTQDTTVPVILSVNTSSGIPSDATGTQATLADNFVDFLAVDTHLTYTDTIYSNYTLVEGALAAIGIRHIRDGWGTGSAFADTFVQKLHTDLGIKMSYVVDVLNENTDPALMLAHWNSTTGMIPCLDYIEGPNEWDGEPNGTTNTIGGVAWNTSLTGIATFVANMQSVFHATGAITAAVPLLGASLANAINQTNFTTMGNLSASLNYANAHDYFGNSEAHMSVLNQIITCNTITMGGATGRNIVTTESGWNGGTNGSTYSATGGNPKMPQAIIAKDLLRMDMMRWNSGRWVRSGIYQLMDAATSDGSAGYGIVKDDGSNGSTYTGTSAGGGNIQSFLYPQALAYQAFISLLSDPGASFTPGVLNFTLTGTQTGSTQWNLFQKSDGSFWLAIWQVNSTATAQGVVGPWNLYNANTGAAVSPAPTPLNITLTLNSDTAVSITQYYPASSGTTPVTTVSNTPSTTITSGAEVNLVKIVIP